MVPLHWNPSKDPILGQVQHRDSFWLPCCKSGPSQIQSTTRISVFTTMLCCCIVIGCGSCENCGGGLNGGGLNCGGCMPCLASSASCRRGQSHLLICGLRCRAVWSSLKACDGSSVSDPSLGSHSGAMPQEHLPLHSASPIRCKFLSRKIRWAKRSSSPARAPVEDDAAVGVLGVELVAEVVAVVAVGPVLVVPDGTVDTVVPVGPSCQCL